MNRLLVWMEPKQVGHYLQYAVPSLVVACLVVWQFATNVHEADFRDNYIAKDYVHNLLLCLPENSLSLARGDVSSMGLNYFQAVLGKRRDLVVLDQERMTYPWYYRQMKERYPDIVFRGNGYDGVKVMNLHLISDNVDRRDVFFRDFKEDSYPKEFQAVQIGLVKKMVRRNVSYPLEKVEKRLNVLYEQFKKRGWQNDWPATSFERVIMSAYAEPLANVAYELSPSLIRGVL